MVGSGVDVYSAGPASVGGALSLEVSGVWLHNPCPYGPVFLMLTSAAVRLTHGNVVAGVLALRLAAVGGVALLVAVLPGLARRCGVAPGVRPGPRRAQPPGAAASGRRRAQRRT